MSLMTVLQIPYSKIRIVLTEILGTHSFFLHCGFLYIFQALKKKEKMCWLSDPIGYYPGRQGCDVTKYTWNNNRCVCVGGCVPLSVTMPMCEIHILHKGQCLHTSLISNKCLKYFSLKYSISDKYSTKWSMQSFAC